MLMTDPLRVKDLCLTNLESLIEFARNCAVGRPMI